MKELGASDHSGAPSPSKPLGKRKENMQARRLRVLGISSWENKTYDGKEASPDGSKTVKRRRQVLQAQRAHRDRTQSYIEELETEVFRLRRLTSRKEEDMESGQEKYSSSTDNETGSLYGISLSTLTQGFRRQIAPGVFEPLKSMSSANGLQVPAIPRTVETHDSLTRMMFSNFSENIAHTLVLNDHSNGYRVMVLPLASENALVRCALLAASACHLSLQQPYFRLPASNLRSIAIRKLSAVSNQPNVPRETVLAAITLLLVADMTSGGSQFEILFNMATLWIDGTRSQHSELQSPLMEFLEDQVATMELCARPILPRQDHVRHDAGFDAHSLGAYTPEQMSRVFSASEVAVKIACMMHANRLMFGAAANANGLVEDLRVIVGEIPPGAPTEMSLAWVYFVAAAESLTASDRNFFARRLMRLYTEEFWGKSNLAIVDELCSDEIVGNYTLHGQRRGKEAIKTMLLDFKKAFPDLAMRPYGPAPMIAEGDYVVTRWIGGGKHTGPAFDDLPLGRLATANSGREIRFTGTTIYTLKDGKIVEETGEEAALVALQQLGILPYKLP
ncbi:hypothetical protein HIM_00335 [Hirsutella minnesotensis 3608]|nr:hypothetical protein HIM_00335 [Hirsutella minnesotensis 3608]